MKFPLYVDQNAKIRLTSHCNYLFVCSRREFRRFLEYTSSEMYEFCLLRKTLESKKYCDAVRTIKNMWKCTSDVYFKISSQYKLEIFWQLLERFRILLDWMVHQYKINDIVNRLAQVYSSMLERKKYKKVSNHKSHACATNFGNIWNIVSFISSENIMHVKMQEYYFM